jgi:hypothetical protein
MRLFEGNLQLRFDIATTTAARGAASAKTAAAAAK